MELQPVLHLLDREDQALLVQDLLLHVVDGVKSLYFQGDILAS